MISPHLSNQELQDSELKNHIHSFGFPLEAGNKESWNQLQTQYSCSHNILQQRQQDILRLRNSNIIEEMYTSLKDLKDSETILLQQIPSETTKAAEGQIFFQGEHTKILNSIPYLLMILVFCKIWIFPILGLMTPVLLFISPYILLQTMFKITISWEMYLKMMKQLVFGINGNEPWSLKHLAQIIWTTLGLGQGIIQPFYISHHTRILDNAIQKRGQALLKIYNTMKQIQSTFASLGVMENQPLQIPDIPTELYEAVSWMENEPLGMKILWTLLGRFTILITIASDSNWNLVEWNGPLVLNNLGDLAIQKPIKSDLILTGHTLLTGPNRGGKSSSLRAILQQVLLGQTFGFTYYTTGSWDPFYKVHTRLKSYDTSGKESLFEMEVRNASRMIHSLQDLQSPCLILIDELFHSTNPPDAETSARIFLDKVWKLPHIKSIISTHIFSLCENPPKNISTLCCPASESSDGSIDYSYKLSEGICRVSSVREVLREAKLLSA